MASTLPSVGLFGSPAAAPPTPYSYAAMIARTQGTCSPETLMRTLTIGQAEAKALYARLGTRAALAPTTALTMSKRALAAQPTTATKPHLKRLSNLAMPDQPETPDEPPEPETAPQTP